MMIEPDIDAYGSLARGSALADYLELLALTEQKCTRAQLEDIVVDKYWTRKRRHMIVDPSDLDDNGELAGEDDELMSYVDEAYECLDERGDTLGSRYPFKVDGSGLEISPSVVVSTDVYIATLCLTSAHAYGVATQTSVTDLFEEIVASTLESRRMLVARVGLLSKNRTFAETLIAVGEALAIPTVLGGAPFNRYANDMGADAVAHWSWQDNRLGRWTVVGQVTCGSSDSWRRKLGEAAPGLWKGWFQDEIDPLCFLAVPHHVPRRTLHRLVQEQRKILVDRLRLVLARDSISADEVAVVAHVMDFGVANLAAA